MDPFELKIKASKDKKLKESWEAVEQQRDRDDSAKKKIGKIGSKTVIDQPTHDNQVSHIFQKRVKPSSHE